MATKYFRDAGGNYVGGFDGAEPPAGSVEVLTPPTDARFKWNGNEWYEPIAIQDVILEEKRAVEVVKQGVTIEDKVNALWLNARGDMAEFNRIEGIISKAEQDIPKPK